MCILPRRRRPGSIRLSAGSRSLRESNCNAASTLRPTNWKPTYAPSSSGTTRTLNPTSGPNLPTKSSPPSNASAKRPSRHYAANFRFRRTRINFRRALLSRPDRRRIPAFYGFVLYAMAHLEAWHLALPKCQATTTRRRAASRWNFHRQIDKPRRMGGRPSNREHADRLRDNTLCRRKPLVCALQLLIEIIEVAWQYPPHNLLRLLRRFCDVHELPGIIAQAGASFRTCSGLAEPFAALFSIRLRRIRPTLLPWPCLDSGRCAIAAAAFFPGSEPALRAAEKRRSLSTAGA